MRRSLSILTHSAFPFSDEQSGDAVLERKAERGAPGFPVQLGIFARGNLSIRRKRRLLRFRRVSPSLGQDRRHDTVSPIIALWDKTRSF